MMKQVKESCKVAVKTSLVYM